MKITLSKLEILAIIILFAVTLYMWTLPIQGLPFGDVDASSHFAIGDYMTSKDKSVAKVPYYIFTRYGGQNSIMPDYLWYPPQYWTNGAIAQVLGGSRIMPFFIMVAILSSLVVFSSYFFVRSLFGFWPAFLSSFLLIFSTRDYMIYLWGQWPQSLSFAFTPLILYCFYKSYMEKRTIYLYMMGLFLAAQFFFHPQGMIASAGAIIVFSIILLIKNRGKLPFNIKHGSIAIVLFAVIAVAFAPLNVGEFFFELKTKQEATGAKTFQADKLFKWYQGIRNDPGLPDFYFRYNTSHGSLKEGFLSWWTLPFLLIGVFALAYRRKDEDLLLLSWLVSFYFLTRLVVFGMGQRDIRMFAYEAHVFYPIIAIGLVSISSLANNNLRKYAKYGLIILFLVLAVSINGQSSYEVLKGMQNSIGRINPSQYEAAEWIRKNLDEKADIYDIGTLGYQNFAAKIKWLGVLSQRHFIVNDDEVNMTDYVFIDYTDALALGSQDYVNVLQSYENQFKNITPTYNKNNIKVYKVA